MMHLESPWITTTVKKKKKTKFRSSEAAMRARTNQKSWQELLTKYNCNKTSSTKPNYQIIKDLVREPLPYRRKTEYIPSLPFNGDPCTAQPKQTYTGSMVKGIATMHKSNAVPIFSDQEAVDVAKMRR